MPLIQRLQTKRCIPVLFIIGLLGIAIVSVGLYEIRWILPMTSNSSSPRPLIAFLSGQLSLPLEPSNISSIPLYHIHKNLWGTLVSERGAPSLGRLTKVSSDERQYQFEILPQSKFSNGRPITADDVVFSLHRLINRQQSGHFNAKSIIDKIEKTSDTTVTISLQQPSSAFLFLLSIPEMGIVPRFSCDSLGNLQDLSVTSGAYSVIGKPDSGQIRLKKNPYFAGHTSASPSEVTLVFKNSKESLIEAMSGDDADFLEAYDTAGIEAFLKSKDSPSFEHTITKPSYSIFLVANTQTLQENQRKWLSKLITEEFAKQYQPIASLETRSFQLLPPATFASLKTTPTAQLLERPKLPKTIRLATVNRTSLIAAKVIATIESLGINVKVDQWDGKIDNTDLILCGQGMNSDFPEVEFHLNMVSSWAFIPASKEEKTLISSAIHSSDIAFRESVITKIGQKLLTDGRVIPLLVRSYGHLYRRGRINLDQADNYDGDILFWKMKVMPQ